VAAAAWSGWHITTRGGRDPQPVDAVGWCVEVARRGAGEILLTSMDRDGTKAGFDIPLVAAVTAAVTIPVIASGGAGTAAHMVEALDHTRASAVLAASIFHFSEVSIGEVKDAMAAAGLPVRRT
ncbi:MAG TPA: HisA/HisF-related TIM barrel protein, partial [Nitriliruptoraceae bacterium]|nr:HisA/HisF-related TIM barrel protein [Nitriliruptoraceae bacterium]